MGMRVRASIPPVQSLDRLAHREALLVWIASIAATAAFGTLGLVVPFVADNLLAFVAATFLYLPAWVLWRRGTDLGDYGLRAAPVVRGLVHFGLVVLLVLPAFAVGYHYWRQVTDERGLALERDRLVRFSRDLDDRPDLDDIVGQEALHVWTEGLRLMVLWTGAGHAEVAVLLQSRDGSAAAPDRLHRFRPAGGELAPDRDATLDTQPGRVSWSRTGAGGFGLSLEGIESFQVEGDAGDVRLGRYAVGAGALPFENRRSAWWWLWMLFIQVILVAIPEEWFYRGYLQQRFDEAWRPRWRILGATLGWGWLLASVLFALGHLVLDPRPSRLAVFFPSLLFGWLRARTGSILAPALFHAVSNVWIQSLAYVHV